MISKNLTSWSVNGLGVYVLVIYGVTYYAVATAAPQMAREFGVNTSTIFGILSAALLITAVLAPTLGRWTDRLGSARMLLLGTIARIAAVIAMALAPDFFSFVAAFLAVQILGQITEYDATFAAAVDVAGDGARQAMSQITLWGGLASTAFWPATVYLLEIGSWRQMLLIFAGVMFAVCLPIAASLHHFRRRHISHAKKAALLAETDALASLPTTPPTARFVLLALAFAFGSVAYGLPTLMLPVLEGLGLGASAVIVGMLFGPAQTAGRLSELLFGHRTQALTVAAIATAALALSLVILLAGQSILIWALLFAVLYGAGGGVSYVVRGAVVLDLYGKAQYAHWLGRLSSVRLIFTATSPFVLSLALERSGAPGAVLVCLAAALLALICFVILRIKPK